MISPNLPEIAPQLKHSLSSGQKTIFSYDLETVVAATGIHYIVRQKETLFSLTLTIEERQKRLFVKNFTLVENPQLQLSSLALYDAAMVEIVIQALSLVFQLGMQEKWQKISFLLKKSEADHLDSFTQAFDLPTSKGARMLLNLSILTANFDFFVNQTEKMSIKIKNELWKMQKDDYCVRSFLNPKKGEVFNVSQGHIDEEEILFSNNVIPFPQLHSYSGATIKII